MKTRAAVLYRTNEPLQIEELEIPTLGKGQVLVKLASAGICRTQLLEFRGQKGEDRFLPHLMGHEGSATVVDVGPDTSKLKVDDFVVLSWIKGIGADTRGPVYKTKSGLNVNAGPVATFTEYAVVSENRCTPISKMDPQVAALLGCAIPTGAGIITNELGITEKLAGKSSLIIGVGGIGASALLTLKKFECHPLIACDITDEKLALAKDLGATHTINPLKQDLVAEVNRITEGGSHFVIEASGVKSAMESAYRCVRPNGGVLVIAGNLSYGEKIEIDPMDLIKGKNIRGTAGGQCKPTRDFPLFADWQQSGSFPFEKIVHGVYPLEKINEAFKNFEAGVPGRLLIEF